ncbi:beta-lactamase family protein [Mucilaginibacter rubeus]|uniref:Beta-lactamase family protein n=1 Tax=Mucilaginibacter rubeus TaxID=2027860 RepID=A0AAE6JKU2_9SPHI|nr:MULTISPECIES: serine hydrolase domain-containing protein [Mucilaginibacter]QEM07899.1 beta-lactamase family protein [Mucilaginibacter rubeus]QEM20351.1 beta-lactamase family protein [Mucilaginibacter gossypii]QTE42929.1 beta-lactamase family protein [Mucilaginibacter rubeus]QTE49530.1 beta-lactamase family protein [Mucilaginibacter rubeus]QTE54626.1 beta-lactamase family protein [Mucilaginibacter rubeus]
MTIPTLRISKHFSFVFLIPAFCLNSLICAGQIRPVASDNPLRSRLDSLVDKCVQRYFQDKRAVGLSIALVQHGKPHFYNYGETKAGNGQRPDNKTIYEIGSMTKSFTGIILAQAILDKKIGLEDDIRKYLQGSYPNLNYKGTPIRIKDLANHTSRITRIFPNMWERPTYDSLNPLSNYSRKLLYEGLHQIKLDSYPGKIYAYSNMAVALLGTILEDTYGQAYFSLVSKNILKPYQMTDTRIDIRSVPPDRVAWPHSAQRQSVPLWDLGEVPAMGALRSTTADLVNYINANNAEANPAIKLSHQRTFGTDQEGMGLNWFIHSSPNGYRILEHGGGTGGSRSSLDCLPQLNSGLVILTNSLANRNDLEQELVTMLLE